jgi:hypothetical protein
MSHEDPWVRSQAKKIDQKIDSLMNEARSQNADENFEIVGEGVASSSAKTFDLCLSKQCGKTQTESVDVQIVTSSNGRKRRVSKCKECGGNKSKFIKSK